MNASTQPVGILSFVVSLGLGLVACEDRVEAEAAAEPVGPETPAEPERPKTPAAGPIEEPVRDVAPPDHQLAFERDRVLEGSPDIRLKILQPAEGDVVHDDTLELSVALQGYDTGPGAGHVHVIVDNQPYEAYYRAGDEPFEIDLSALPPGVHTIRAFPSRPWHESIKQPGAFAATHFFYREKRGNPPPLDGPMLTFSRPKGAYDVSPAENRILLDWYVTGCRIGKQCMVRYTLDDLRPQTVEHWVPIWLESLPQGTHTLMLELVDPRGRLIAHPYNRTTREFEVRVQGAS